MEIHLSPNLLLNRCPHCRIDSPNLSQLYKFFTSSHDDSNPREWAIYVCKKCGGIVTAYAIKGYSYVVEVFPNRIETDNNIPEKAKAYLDQAINSIHAPSGAVMLAASSVDAMLKEKGYKIGNLYGKIKSALNDHLITKEMSNWAHEVRLDANDERHADDNAELPNGEDAKRAIDFALALAEFLFVLPSRVQRGIENAKSEDAKNE